MERHSHGNPRCLFTCREERKLRVPLRYLLAGGKAAASCRPGFSIYRRRSEPGRNRRAEHARRQPATRRQVVASVARTCLVGPRFELYVHGYSSPMDSSRGPTKQVRATLPPLSYRMHRKKLDVRSTRAQARHLRPPPVFPTLFSCT